MIIKSVVVNVLTELVCVSLVALVAYYGPCQRSDFVYLTVCVCVLTGIEGINNTQNILWAQCNCHF